MPRPKKYKIVLSDQECQDLKKLIHNKKTSRTIRCRCQIILDLDEAHGKVPTYEQCARMNGVCPATISNTVIGFEQEGISYVKELKRNPNSNQARRKVDGRMEARIVALACGPAPEGHSRWTIRLLADQLKIELDDGTSVDKETIRRTLKKTNLDLIKTNTGASPKRQTTNS